MKSTCRGFCSNVVVCPGSKCSIVCFAFISVLGSRDVLRFLCLHQRLLAADSERLHSSYRFLNAFTDFRPSISSGIRFHLSMIRIVKKCFLLSNLTLSMYRTSFRSCCSPSVTETVDRVAFALALFRNWNQLSRSTRLKPLIVLNVSIMSPLSPPMSSAPHSPAVPRRSLPSCPKSTSPFSFGLFRSLLYLLPSMVTKPRPRAQASA